jgi:hypothetical protein
MKKKVLKRDSFNVTIELSRIFMGWWTGEIKDIKRAKSAEEKQD